MFAIFEQFPDGQEMWARRREHPGEGRLMWHMAASADRGAMTGDVGLLTGSREELLCVSESLIRMRWSRGMTSTVTLVQVD